MSDLVKEFLHDERAFLEKNYMHSTNSVIRKNDPDPQGLSWNGTRKVAVQKKIKAGHFFLEEQANWNCQGKAKRFITLSYVDDADVASKPPGSLIKAYWLAYEQNKAYRAVLSGSDAKYMFTSNMNGCTFAHGMQSGTNDIVVGHSNAIQVATDVRTRLGDVAGRSAATVEASNAAQASVQTDMVAAKLRSGGAATPIKLHPNSYGEGAYTNSIMNDAPHGSIYGAFVVGVYKDSTWKFYCQRRIMVYPRNVTVQDVIEI